MGIQSEIDRIQHNVAGAFSAVEAMGGTVPGTRNSAGLSEAIRTIPLGAEGGDHRVLTHRDAAEQHPITAIAGLKAELDRIPEPVEALTNTELEEMLT